jgi:Ni/Co efflux regulator RcnB
MGLILEGLSAVCLVLLIVWLLSLRGSVGRDQTEAAARQAQEQVLREQIKRDARLHRKGEKLRCLGCENAFLGPLPDTGCPHCHLSALVVTEHDYQKGRHAAQEVRQQQKEK